MMGIISALMLFLSSLPAECSIFPWASSYAVIVVLLSEFSAHICFALFLILITFHESGCILLYIYVLFVLYMSFYREAISGLKILIIKHFKKLLSGFSAHCFLYSLQAHFLILITSHESE